MERQLLPAYPHPDGQHSRFVIIRCGWQHRGIGSVIDGHHGCGRGGRVGFGRYGRGRCRILDGGEFLGFISHDSIS